MREQLFAAEENYILGYLDRVENATEEQTRLAASMFDGKPDDDEDPLDDIYEDDGEEIRIRIEGVISQNGPPPIARLFGYQGASYKAIRAACLKASESPTKNVTWLIDSVGGESAGCQQTFQAMKALAAMKKCTAINTGTMASAGYWLGCSVGPGNLFSDSPANETGSIGVKTVLFDDSKAQESEGYKRITIVSKNAKNKSGDPATAAGRSIMQDRCDAMERQFMADVSAGRGIPVEKIISDFGNGAVFPARDPQGEMDALKSGMIDGIVTPRGIPSAISVPDNFSRQRPGALAAVHDPKSELGRKPMTLKEYLASDPSALAEYNAALKAERDAGAASVQARITAAQPFLALSATKDGYTTAEVAQIAKCAVDVIGGTEDPGALRGFVRMVDMQVENRKQTLAAAETLAPGETPPKKIEQDTDLLAKAAELKIDVPALQAAALAAKMDPVAALTAEIANREMLAADRARTGA